MKKWGILLLAALVGVVVLAGCQNNYLTADDLNGYVKTSTCMACHNSDLSGNDNLVAARSGYDASGHAAGPRILAPAGSSEMYEAEGSNAMYTNGADCSKCHNNEGFVNWVKNGPQTTTSTDFGSIANTSSDGGATAVIGCFTCHNPHSTYTMALRVENAVKLPSGMSTSATASNFVFDGGAGNLCVNCHQDRTTPLALTNAVSPSVSNAASGVPDATATNVKITARFGTHHGPQSDLMVGVDGWDGTGTAVATAVNSVHLAATDTCVTCHMFTPTTRSGVTERIVGHGMYLTDSVHGTSTDFVASCKQCHTTSTGTTFAAIKSAPNKITQIEAAKLKLLAFFGTGANFYTAKTGTTANVAGKGAVTDLSGADLTVGATSEWNKDWIFQSGTTYTTVPVSKALWNFHLFMEDKSRGVHNPVYAAQLLYDAMTLCGLTTDRDAIWASRPN